MRSKSVSTNWIEKNFQTEASLKSQSKQWDFKNQSSAVRGYRLSKYADEDLLSIFRYTHETWGEEQVRIYLSLLEAARDQLTQNPFCPGSKPREDLAVGCRIFRAGKHYFVYRIQDEYLATARILHESMDFESQFDGRDFD